MLDLGFVQNLILNCDDRGYNSEKYNAIVQVLKSLNINNINPMFGTDANPSISTRAYLSNQNNKNQNNNNSGSETVMENNNNLYLNGNTSSIHLLDQEITLHLDTVMLTQHHKLKLVDQPNRDSTITLTDSGKITSGTMVAIVDPATHKALPVGFIGEVWVYSKANAQTIRHYPASTSSNSPSSSNHSMYTAHINANKAILSDNACAHEFIKTNVYGFLYLKKDDTEPYLFIVGKFADLIQKAVACKQNVLDTYQPSLPLAPFSTSKQEEQKKNFGSLQYTSCYYYKRDIRESVMGLNNIISAVSKSQLEIFESVEVLAFGNSKKVTLTLNGQKNNNNKNGRNNDGSMVKEKKKKGDEWVEIQEEEVSGSGSKRYQQMREKVDPSDWAIKSQVRAYLQGHNLEVIDYL
ncbi:hypothetical protein AX774_g4296 [Zancudomyces culisetae]|uniref:Uncharacterized protein n=1 Tax=Zancudomyces culisetae TaxID=1213189 RepID=A0A1R1PMM5_ZANCU|nr:hypothetical protein AX774_g5241 [Zancudomyces culisetae]OMH82225.1 hypothetical protein AX774_g4296 [Zancudomyces culisetae]|eukprot:OMH81297.1 hypothetical protein AX774_g5241 [Zancudomyces culisetae]